MRVIALSFLLLSGCAVNDIAHRYTPTPDPDLTGYWVGEGGGQTQYVNIREDGTGEECWETQGQYNSAPAVISNGKLISKGEMTITKKGPDNFQKCMWGICIDMHKIPFNRVAAQCKQWFNQ